MIRLFVSLYLVIIIGIFSINWLSEYLWQQWYGEDSHELTLVKQLAQSLASTTDINELSLSPEQTHSLAISTMHIDDIAWLAEQKTQLQAGNVISSFNSNGQLLLFVKQHDTERLLQIGPFNHIAKEQPNNVIFLMFSYGLLAIFVALWTRPVWHDLQQLKKLVQAPNNINSVANVNSRTKHSRSAIAPVVSTINQMAQRIQQLLNEQKHLINAVSHELRTPLSRLRFALAVTDGLPKQQQREIEQDIQEIESLVDEMLSYSRIEHIALEQDMSQVNIMQLLKHQAEKHQRSTNKKIHRAGSLEVLWNCNGDLLERACQNLITNAIRYAQDNIYISTRLEKDTLFISVEDDGGGIAKKQWSTLFDPFTRLDKSRNKANGGYGLGLAIVKKACELHRGKCEVEHSVYGGAKFTLVIPSAIC